MEVKDDDITVIILVKKAVLTDQSGRYTASDIQQKLTLAYLIDPGLKLVPFLSELVGWLFWL